MDPIRMAPLKLTQPRSALLRLPLDVIAYTASFLSSAELAQTLSLCREWRSILETIPTLWQDLFVDMTRCHSLVSLRHKVAYSRGLPLYLRLHCLGAMQCAGTLLVLKESMHRIRDLIIWFDSDPGPYDVRLYFGKLLTALCFMPAPELRYLMLGCSVDPPKGGLAIPRAIFAGRAPKLTTLVLDYGIWINEQAITPALQNVQVITASPMHWDVTVPPRLLPRLEVIHYCEVFNPISSVVPMIDYDDPLPDNWRPFNTLGFRVNELHEEDLEDYNALVDQVLAITGGALRGGVKHILIRSVDALPELMTAACKFLAEPRGMSITYGGYDSGLESAQLRQNRLSIELNDSIGRSVTVGHTAKPSVSERNPDLVAEKEAELLETLHPDLFAPLTRLCLCESILELVLDYLAPIRAPELVSLILYVVPSGQRSSPQLIGSEESDPLIIAPKLRALRLATHPTWPKYSRGGSLISSVRPFVVIDEPYEVSALSVNDFIKRKLTFDERPLREVILDKQVVFSEGFRSPEADTLRGATGRLHYDED